MRYGMGQCRGAIPDTLVKIFIMLCNSYQSILDLLYKWPEYFGQGTMPQHMKFASPWLAPFAKPPSIYAQWSFLPSQPSTSMSFISYPCINADSLQEIHVTREAFMNWHISLMINSVLDWINGITEFNVNSWCQEPYSKGQAHGNGWLTKDVILVHGWELAYMNGAWGNTRGTPFLTRAVLIDNFWGLQPELINPVSSKSFLSSGELHGQIFGFIWQ